MALSFRGGIHPDEHKELTQDKAIELLPAPQFVTLPVSMHIGAPNAPIVNVGDRVLLGQKIADTGAAVAAPIHASVSGIVKEIGPMRHPNGTDVMSIVIENDFLDEKDPALAPVDIDTLQKEDIIRHIREAGIVGHGGAAFPTHIKLSSAMDKIDNVLINAAECEPYITSDNRIMAEYPWELMGGSKILLHLFGIKRIKIGIEANKKSLIPILKEHLPPDDTIEIVTLQTKYPQGSEKQLIDAMLNREVPSGKLPADVNCLVINVDTVAAIYRYFTTGMPMIRRIVTVSGSAISNPKNLEVRIGTPVENLIEACGGAKAPPQRLIMGGPMMGVPLFTTEVPVIKGTNAILAFCQNESKTSKAPSCIRCGKCLDSCPMRLVPTYIYSAAIKGSTELLEHYNALDCIECGACTYVCPGKVPLVQAIRTGKAQVQEARRKAAQSR